MSKNNIYSVGRTELLRWLSDVLGEEVARVEDVASGHHYCVLLELIYPGQINFGVVIKDAALDWERVQNLKLVQQVLTRNKVDRVVDVNRLSKGKFYDNIEFMQWFKWFFEQNVQISQINNVDGIIKRIGKKSTAGKAQPTPPKTKYQIYILQKEQARKEAMIEELQHSAVAAGPQAQKLTQELAQKKKESKFYFDKLRDIEIYMGDITDVAQERGIQNDGDALNPLAIVARVEQFLYAQYDAQQ